MPRIEIPAGTRIRSVDLAHDSSAKVLLVRSTFGRLYVKGPIGPEGDGMLLREWIGTRLADHFGLPTFQYGLMARPLGDPADELSLSDGTHLRHDVVFAAVLEQGATWEGGQEQLGQVGNRSAFSRLVVFDTWIRNLDRYVPLPGGRIHQNKGNVFISSESRRGRHPQILAMDHTHVLGGDAVLEQGRASPYVQDNGIYGHFPEFAGFVSGSDIESALEALAIVDFADIQGVVGSVPGEWGMSVDRVQRLSEFLVARARYVAGRGSRPFLDALGILLG
ncbi:HipA family kinase [Pararoseomonas sp. SCSIO 73927]|uniref:HipA family kinase n=1 Tax=Pararoseomonas sp. SCSIO 73927 TaxID=3114537 RepID=UPI0030CB0270